MEGKFDLLSSPFTCDTAKGLQMGLIDSQSDNFLKGVFESKPLIDFNASLHTDKFRYVLITKNPWQHTVRPL